MSKNLVIVESPAKAKTIEKFLGKDFTVKSSFGHVRDLSKSNLGVDVKKDFVPKYINDPEKKKVISELKKLSQEAETVWLATDEDREGEAIAWHLKETLKLEDDKIKRIVFHEITKEAILKAVANPRTIDYNLVNAQQARRVLDRLVGFELSPLLWQKIRPSLSAGRVQSVALRLIVEREIEIKDFKPEISFKVVGVFQLKNGEEFKADINKKFSSESEALGFLEQCKGKTFRINNITKKPAKKSPPPPFTTSTLQQEAARKLGFSVIKTMMTAQKLYESGQITYMRTDSLNLSDLAINTIKSEIQNSWGDEYSKVRKFTTKTKGAQEAHEAIRPTYADRHEAKGDASQKRLYNLIWKRTLASQMSDAQFERTQFNIIADQVEYPFVAKGEVITFDGFLKLYTESTDDDENQKSDTLLPKVSVNDEANYISIDAQQKFSKHPPRFTEASLVKKLEELGIGRPSTYAPTISTIIKRQYIVKKDLEGKTRKVKLLHLANETIENKSISENYGFEKSKLFPTDIGNVVTKFLKSYFDNIMDYGFTALAEEEFDKISAGEAEWNKMIGTFYHGFKEKVESTKKNADRQSGERLLGKDPKTGKNLYVKIGRYGAIAQIGETTDENKPRFAGLNDGQSIEDITLEEALKLFDFPKFIGNFQGEELFIAVGRFGPYIRKGKSFYSIPKSDNYMTLELDRAIEIIKAKDLADKNKLIQEYKDEDIRVLNGRFGPYISHKKKNYKIPKTIDPKSLNLEQCKEIIEKTATKKGNGRKKKS